MDTTYFAIALSAIELVSYYLGLDLLIIFAVSFCLSFTLLFKKRIDCLLFIFLIMSSMISLKNSPTSTDSDCNPLYFFQPGVYIPCFIAAAIPVLITIACFIKNIVKKEINYNLTFAFTLILGATFLTNGIMTDIYNPLGALFGGFLFFFFVIFFYAIFPRINFNKESIILISRQVCIYSVVIIVELATFYFSTIFAGEEIYPRFSNIILGWGNRNTIGMLFVVVFCFILFSLENEENFKFKIFSYVVGSLVIVGTIISFSRQAYLALIGLIFIYLFIRLFNTSGTERKKYIWLLCSGGFVVCSIFVALCISGYISKLDIDNLSNGRIPLWEAAISNFERYPIFGGGFYFNGGDPKIKLENIMPFCCHNTILQMLGACGIVGLAAYLVYRVFTIRDIYKNMKTINVYPVLALSMLLLMSLIDIHIFDLLGTGLYVVLLAFCMREKQENVEKNEIKREMETIEASK